MVASLYIVGRPKFVQIIAIIISLTLGVGALSFLPRMSQMGDLRSDHGVQGRLLAWEVARGVTQTHSTGVGWNEFVAFIDWKEGNRTIYGIPKATHSSYVKIAADLGSYGLFIYLAGLWCVVHTLISFRPANDIEDRCRRFLWILLISNIASGWMINREYHTEHFLLLAAAAALHRLAKARESGFSSSFDFEIMENQKEEIDAKKQSGRALTLFRSADSDAGDSFDGNKSELNKKPLWNKFGILDFMVCFALTWFTLWVWDYILLNI